MERIAVDIDEVMYPYLTEWCKHFNEENGTNYKPSDFKTYGFDVTVGLSDEEAIYEDDRLYLAGGYKSGKAIEGSSRALRNLSSKYELYVVTARQESHSIDTIQWVADNYVGVFNDVIFCNTHPRGEEVARKKSEVCIELGAKVIIEDTIEHALECSEAGVIPILFGDYSWNNHEVPANLMRAKSWKEVEMILSNMSAMTDSSKFNDALLDPAVLCQIAMEEFQP